MANGGTSAVSNKQNRALERKSEFKSKAARHREIHQRYKWHAGQSVLGDKVSKKQALIILRVAELKRICDHRFGPTGIPNNEQGMKMLRVIAAHLECEPGNAQHRVEGWIRTYTPWGNALSSEELKSTAFAALAIGQRHNKIVNGQRRIMSADSCASVIGLDMATRTALDIRTIGATDYKKHRRTLLAKRNRRAKAAERRRGAVPREQSLSRTEPWKALGVCRRTWENRRKRGEI
jgi:hypothetical protein